MPAASVDQLIGRFIDLSISPLAIALLIKQSIDRSTNHSTPPSSRPSTTTRPQALAAQDAFNKIVLVGRRQAELPKGPGYEKMVCACTRLLSILGACRGCGRVWD
jgi:hypothetical protein